MDEEGNLSIIVAAWGVCVSNDLSQWLKTKGVEWGGRAGARGVAPPSGKHFLSHHLRFLPIGRFGKDQHPAFKPTQSLCFGGIIDQGSGDGGPLITYACLVELSQNSLIALPIGCYEVNLDAFTMVPHAIGRCFLLPPLFWTPRILISIDLSLSPRPQLANSKGRTIWNCIP